MNSWRTLTCLLVAALLTSCKEDTDTSAGSSWHDDSETRLIEYTSSSLDLIAEEPFDTSDSNYIVNTNLLGQKPITLGFQGMWLANINRHLTQVLSNGLVYPHLQSSGGKVEAPTNKHRGRIGRRLSNGYTNSSNGSVYISFLYQINEIGAANIYRAFELHDSTLDNDQNGFSDKINRKFALGTCENDFGTIGFGFRADNDIAFSRELSDVRNLDVNLFVLKFDLSDEPLSDSVTVWMNPTLGEAPDDGVSVSGFDISFDTVTLARFGTTVVSIDEIRIGKTFAAVTPQQ